MARTSEKVKIALFCGGSGTRLWPMSRGDKPKQFQPLIGKKSTFQIMVERLKKGFSPADIFPVTSRDYVGLVAQQASEIPLENIIIEPERRDTLAAVGLAAVVLDKKFDNPVVVSVWSDHLVKNDNEFTKAVKTAVDLASRQDKSVEISVRPTFPSAQLGYLQVGKMIKKVGGLAVFEFVKQIEKPSVQEAKDFVKSWEYLWHIGYQVWKAKGMLKFFAKYQPEVYKLLTEIGQAVGTKKYERTLAAKFPKIPKMSIDFGILEKLTEADQLVILADLGWSDLGSWDVLKNELSDGARENVIAGEVINLDVRDCLVYAATNGKIVAAIGLEGIIIVDTPDALLVCPKTRSADVKKIVNQLQKAKKDKLL